MGGLRLNTNTVDDTSAHLENQSNGTAHLLARKPTRTLSKIVQARHVFTLRVAFGGYAGREW